jgi:hypothetical protein
MVYKATGSTVSLTIKPDMYLSATGHIFEITCHVKDNRLAASQCAAGNLKITVYHAPGLSGYPHTRLSQRRDQSVDRFIRIVF